MAQGWRLYRQTDTCSVHLRSFDGRVFTMVHREFRSTIQETATRLSVTGIRSQRVID
jgi:hypothetical protein